MWLTFSVNDISRILHNTIIYGETHVEQSTLMVPSIHPVYWSFSSDSQTYDLLQYVFSEMTLSEEASAKPR